MKKLTLAIFFLCACCARPAPVQISAAPGSAVRDRADALKQQGRYLEALSYYRDIQMNPGWARQAGPEPLLAMADIYRSYVGDLAEAALWSARYRESNQGAMPGAPIPGAAAPVAMPGSIRVLIADAGAPVRISSDAPIRFLSGGAELLAASGVACAADNSTIFLQQVSTGRSCLLAQPAPDRNLSISGGAYRGACLLQASGGHLLVINQVPVEEYLWGVLPREMSPSWPLEALKAQAVAARTYALYHAMLRKAEPYDVLATTASQVYGGTGSVHPAVRRAVEETSGLVLADRGRLALALFHANSGGRTEAFGDIWGGHVPYLVSVPDQASTGLPGAAWDTALPERDIAQALGQFGILTGAVQDIIPRDRSATGRIMKLELRTENGSLFLSGNSFRLMAGPGKVKGTNFQVRKSGSVFYFSGRGYGHGAGMSQWGARAMAQSGSSFAQILARYYPEANLAPAGALLKPAAASLTAP